MKKITEAELKNRVNSLREYVASLDERVVGLNAIGSAAEPKDRLTSIGTIIPQSTTTTAATPVAASTSVPRDAAGINMANKPSSSKPAQAYVGSAGARQIQSLNKNIIKDINKIYPGQTLTMPDNSKYTVKSSDTLDKIAKGANPAAPLPGDPKIAPVNPAAHFRPQSPR